MTARADVRRMRVGGLTLAATFVGLVALGASGQTSVCQTAARHTVAQARRLVYVKSEHRLCLLDREVVLWEHPASHGRNAGKKRVEADGKTPEGRYTVSPARPSQKFGLFLHISYPNADDVRAARAQGKQPGGDIGVHGPQRWYAFLGAAQALIDHSDGCIVVDADGIKELAQRVKTKIPMEIFGTLP